MAECLVQPYVWAHSLIHAVSSRLADHSGQLTALVMKAALSAELEDESGVQEAEARHEQLLADHEAMMNAR